MKLSDNIKANKVFFVSTNRAADRASMLRMGLYGINDRFVLLDYLYAINGARNVTATLNACGSKLADTLFLNGKYSNCLRSLINELDNPAFFATIFNHPNVPAIVIADCFVHETNGKIEISDAMPKIFDQRNIKSSRAAEIISKIYHAVNDKHFRKIGLNDFHDREPAIDLLNLSLNKMANKNKAGLITLNFVQNMIYTLSGLKIMEIKPKK